MSYKIKPRPTLFELSIMEGVLNGGGHHSPVERQAYWAETPEPAYDPLMMQDVALKKQET